MYEDSAKTRRHAILKSRSRRQENELANFLDHRCGSKEACRDAKKLWSEKIILDNSPQECVMCCKSPIMLNLRPDFPCLL